MKFKVHHIGNVVADIIESISLYSKLGYEVMGSIIIDEVQNNKIVFLNNGENIIELIEPLNEKSSIKNLRGYAHICYEVDDIEIAKNYILENELGIVFTEKLVAPAINNRSIIFIYLKNGNIIELIER